MTDNKVKKKSKDRYRQESQVQKHKKQKYQNRRRQMSKTINWTYYMILYEVKKMKGENKTKGIYFKVINNVG